MSKIIIKKKVDLAFLGTEYAEAYLTFRSIPLKDYEEVVKKMPKTNPRLLELKQVEQTGEMSDADKNELELLSTQEADNNIKNFSIILEFLKKYYIGGKFPNDAGELEDIDSVEEIDSLDKDTVTICFETLTGQNSDPKVS